MIITNEEVAGSKNLLRLLEKDYNHKTYDCFLTYIKFTWNAWSEPDFSPKLLR